MAILVTGGNGYIGSQLMTLLDNAVVLDNLSMSSPKNLFGVIDKQRFVLGDIRNKEDIKKAIKIDKVDSIIHLAALTGADDTIKKRDLTFDINLEGTRNMLEAARKFDIKRFVFPSSCNVYGRSEEQQLLEESTSFNPVNPYGETKLKGEKLCREYKEKYGISTVALRLSTNYGYSPGIRFNLVVNMFVFKALTGQPLTIYGDGTNWRPFINVQDSAAAFKFFTENNKEGIFNVGYEDGNYQIKQIVDVIKKYIPNIKVDYLGDKEPGPSYNVCFDKLKKKTNFKFKHDLNSGVKELIEKFKNG